MQNLRAAQNHPAELLDKMSSAINESTWAQVALVKTEIATTAQKLTDKMDIGFEGGLKLLAIQTARARACMQSHTSSAPTRTLASDNWSNRA